MPPTTPTTHRELPPRRGSWHLAALRTVLATVALGLLLCAGVTSSAQAADSCPNAVQRAANASTELPDCRAYEMVSSPYKEGFAVLPRIFTDEGIVSYSSTGTFAGSALGLGSNLYHATRSSAGWVTTAPSPPGVTYSAGGGASAESADLRSSLWVMRRRDGVGGKDLYLRGLDGELTFVGQGASADGVFGSPGVDGASADLSHVIFRYGSSGSGDATALREFVGTGNVGPARVVSVDNLGNPTAAETCPNKISDDGRVIVYSAGCHVGTLQLWARVAGSATVAVSGSECTRSSGDLGGVCSGLPGADYAGSADDGSRVFFTTSQQLVNADTDTTSDLYACDIPPGSPAPVGTANACASLTEVSGTASGAQVQSVVAISGDGSRVYFVAQGVLANNVGVGDNGPSAGANNLYLWERNATYPAGHTRFVAGLGTGPAANDLTGSQMTPDGRYLTFLTANALVTTGPAADTDGARDVYRYDSVTGSIVRVSTSTSGGGGNDPAYDAGLGGISQPASMTSDGSSIVFDTAEALSPSDTDGTTDVYAWHDGHVSLITNGGANLLWISPSGRDIYFQTPVALVAADRDVTGDIYDARAGGGFDPTQTASCSGVECRGQQSLPPSLVGPSAPASAGGGPVEAAPSFSLGVVSAAQRKRLAATGKITLTITTNAAGTISATAAATIGGRSVTVGSARRTLTAPGRVTVSLTLSRKARAQLAAKGKLSVKVTVAHSKVALDRSVTLRLSHAKAKAKRKSAGGLHARRAVVSGDRGGRS
jgi:hypothetical protein